VERALAGRYFTRRVTAEERIAYLALILGIIGLLAIGYLWMLEIGVSEASRVGSRATSMAYGGQRP
jgi:hypothetical protein